MDCPLPAAGGSLAAPHVLIRLCSPTIAVSLYRGLAGDQSSPAQSSRPRFSDCSSSSKYRDPGLLVVSLVRRPPTRTVDQCKSAFGKMAIGKRIPSARCNACSILLYL